MSKKIRKAKIQSTARRNQPESNPNEVKTKLLISSDFNEGVKEEILDVLANTKFNKISVPLGTYRYLVENVAEGDNRIVTVGYIKKYNADKQEFTVILFNNMCSKIKEMGDLAIELLCTMFAGRLGTITKFNIIPVEEGDEKENIDNAPDDNQDEPIETNDETLADEDVWESCED